MQTKLRQPEDIKTLHDLREEIGKVLLLADPYVIDIVAAGVVANRMNLDPLWLMLVAPSSGGKSEVLNITTGLDFVYPISDITTNTFLSGQKKLGKETSLLLKMNNGVMMFKDFTSIISKDRESKKAIMGQLREIFDGEYTKRTGTGDDPTWRGKVGALAGVTESIYRHLEDMTAMGDRFIMYTMAQPDRKEMSKRQLSNAHHMADYRDHMKLCFKFFVNHVLENMADDEVTLSEEVKEELFKVADFATLVRSAVLVDFKSGQVDFVPAPEMPARVTSQLYTLASALIAMDLGGGRVQKQDTHAPRGYNNLTKEQTQLLYKVAFDSIPRTRRDALRVLAKHKGGVTSAGFASSIGLPTASSVKYLYQLNALGICHRTRRTGPTGDHWSLVREDHRELICKLEGIIPVESELTGREHAESEGGGDDPFDDPHILENINDEDVF